MIELSVTAKQAAVAFAPVDVAEEVFQNVRTIISTQKGTVPFDRDFGLDWDFIDKPINVAHALVSAEIAKQLRKYEPRAKIIEITLVESNELSLEGKMIPKVTIGVIE